MFKYLSILAFLIGSNTWLFAQEPSYVLVGDYELAGIDIYTLAQDKQKFIWLGTENGLFKYDGVTFKKYTNNQLKTKSVFGFVKDNFGDLFCFNLSGQILKIKNDSVEIFYQIPDSLLSSYYEIGFDYNNHLIIATFIPFRLNKDKQPELLFDNKLGLFLSSFKKYDNKLFFSLQDSVGSQAIYLDKKNKLHYLSFEKIQRSNPKVYLQNSLNYTIVKDRDNFNYYTFKNDNATEILFNLDNSITQRYSSVCYLANDSSIWQTTRRGGTVVLNTERTEAYHRKLLFNKFFVSSYLEDHEGNFWLATLGRGLLFIPNQKLFSYKNITGIEEEVFTKLLSIKNIIYASTLSGKIYTIKNNQLELSFNQNNTKISLLKYDEKSQKLIIDGANTPVFIDIFSKKLNTTVELGAVKDLDFINDSVIVFSTNVGVSFYNKVLNTTTDLNYKHPENIGRTSGIYYQKSKQQIWVSTLKGLMVLSKQVKPLLFDSIFPTKIIDNGNKIWVATKDKGIYVFNDLNITNHYNSNNLLISDAAYKIEIIDNNLYVAHELGLQIIDLKTYSSINIDKTDGLFLNRISDFAVLKDHVYITTNKGLQFFNLNDINKNKTKPNILLTQFIVNNKNIKRKSIQKYFFNYQENNIELQFVSNSFRNQRTLKYAYKIDEIDNRWYYNSSSENNIKFTSLSPGTYTIVLKAINENLIESNPLIIKIYISPPFWSTWWFYSCLGLIFIAIIVVIFRYQLKKQRKKITLQNELNASKLIAIQSQMNPHFIFNAINSIQDLILQGDIDNSYSYIIKFSKLVRKTLDFSGKEFIDIEDEIELLGIYLELEKLRFKADFNYVITTNDIEDIQVPPMLIQPFVENAIKHGLLHKEGNKSVSITFKLGETLTCIVEDNGIGRKKAQEIKNRQQKTHKSFSVSATETRFNIMKSHYQQDLGITYQDLFLIDQSIGTKVIIEIPYKQNY